MSNNKGDRGFIGGIGVSRHLCMDIDHDGLCDRCGKATPPTMVGIDWARAQVDQSSQLDHATATKVWKVECPCGTNWVYTEFSDSLPDECENCGRPVDIMPGELAMDSYDRKDLAIWLGVNVGDGS